MQTESLLPREGMLIPGFALPRADGRELRVRGYRGRRSLLLAFVCDAACARCGRFLANALERYAEYADAGAEVLAIIPGNVDSARSLQHTLALPFPVLADEGRTVATRYGLNPGEAAVLVADRYGEPRIWQRGGSSHTLPPHAPLLAELRYLSLTCSGGAPRPLWPDP